MVYKGFQQMITLFVLLTSAVLLVALAVSLSDINPYQSEEVPMLDQIEAFMRSSSSPSSKSSAPLDLAA